MRAFNSRIPDLTVVGSSVAWIWAHAAQFNIGVQILAGVATVIAMIAASRYHRLKRRALSRWLAGGGAGNPP